MSAKRSQQELRVVNYLLICLLFAVRAGGHGKHTADRWINTLKKCRSANAMAACDGVLELIGV